MAGQIYNVVKDFAELFILAACLIAMYRRTIIKPERYAVPAKYGKEHTWEAMLVLLLITGLVTCDMVFEGSLAGAQIQNGLETEILAPMTGTWIAAHILRFVSVDKLQNIYLGAYFYNRLLRKTS